MHSRAISPQPSARSTHARYRITIALALTACLAGPARAAAPPPAPEVTATELRISRIQTVVDDLRTRLALSADVATSIDEVNPLMVSVSAPIERAGAYHLSFERGFLDQLSDTELRAVVAHELGHVWIFTHHPFLQTEELANSIALRVVSRDTLEAVYAKVWAHGGMRGDIARFPGDVARMSAVRTSAAQ